jgi:hypothetical protein
MTAFGVFCFCCGLVCFWLRHRQRRWEALRDDADREEVFQRLGFTAATAAQGAARLVADTGSGLGSSVAPTSAA